MLQHCVQSLETLFERSQCAVVKDPVPFVTAVAPDDEGDDVVVDILVESFNGLLRALSKSGLEKRLPKLPNLFFLIATFKVSFLFSS